MGKTSITGMDASRANEHRKAWLEHYLARMASDKTFPVCSGYTDTADCCGMNAQDVYEIEAKFREKLKNLKPMLDSNHAKY